VKIKQQRGRRLYRASLLQPQPQLRPFRLRPSNQVLLKALRLRKEPQELTSPIALYPDAGGANSRGVHISKSGSGSGSMAEAKPKPVWRSARCAGQSETVGSECQVANSVPTLLQSMNGNPAWTSAPGDAYYNQPADVMSPIQILRNMAVSAGTLKSTPQQTVEVQQASPAAQSGSSPSVQQTVIVQPASSWCKPRSTMFPGCCAPPTSSTVPTSDFRDEVCGSRANVAAREEQLRSSGLGLQR